MNYKDYLKAFTDITDLIPKNKRVDAMKLRVNLNRAVDDYIWDKVNENTKEMLYNKDKEIHGLKEELAKFRGLAIDPYKNSGKYKGD